MVESILPRTVELADGAELELRLLSPDDRQQWLEGLERLSDTSRYRRFGSMRPLTADEVDRAFAVDHVNHVAIVAIHEDVGVGLGRYIRDHADPGIAELAVTVLDDFQGRGIGRVVTEVVAEVARANGVEVLRSWVMADNVASLGLLSSFGAEVPDVEAEVIRIDLPLTDPDVEALPSLRHMLAVAARRELAFGLSHPAMWLTHGRRRDEPEAQA